MKKFWLFTAGLILLLFISNGWWILKTLNMGISAEYRELTLLDNHEALTQTLKILPIVSNPNSTKSQIIEAAKSAASNNDTFEKDGYTWIGKLGLKFDKNERLVEVVPSWEPY